ncbi:hypothetical protein LRY58_01560 [Candidatus Woesebacteria bacterium]|nr:hypothetical protein [Candidatus Woesebacteria bacterium]
MLLQSQEKVLAQVVVKSQVARGSRQSSSREQLSPAFGPLLHSLRVVKFPTVAEPEQSCAYTGVTNKDTNLSKKDFFSPYRKK